MTERNADPSIDLENSESTEDQLDAEEAVTPEDITDTEFGEDPDIEVPSTAE